jgi:hypothetical protein
VTDRDQTLSQPKPTHKGSISPTRRVARHDAQEAPLIGTKRNQRTTYQNCEKIPTTHLSFRLSPARSRPSVCQKLLMRRNLALSTGKHNHRLRIEYAKKKLGCVYNPRKRIYAFLVSARHGLTLMMSQYMWIGQFFVPRSRACFTMCAMSTRS